MRASASAGRRCAKSTSLRRSPRAAAPPLNVGIVDIDCKAMVDLLPGLATRDVTLAEVARCRG